MEEENKDKKEESDSVSWNIAKSHSELISALIGNCAVWYRTGNITDLFYGLCTIREMINHDLKPSDVKRFDKIEHLARTRIIHWKKRNQDRIYDIDTSKKTRKYASEFFKIVVKYQRTILKTLKQQGFFPSKEETRYLKGAQ